MASNTLSVYCPSPLFERAKEAQAEGKISIKDVCNEALQNALTALDMPAPPGLIVPGADPLPGTADLDLTKVSDAAELAQQASEIEYQFSVANTIVDAQAFLDHVASQGAWPVSHHVDLNGQFSILVAWPKVLGSAD